MKINKRGNKYTCVIDVGVDGERKQKRITGQTKKEVKAAIHEIKSQMNNGTYTEPRKIPFSELAELWLNQRKHKVRHSTFKTYRQVLQTNILPYLKDAKLQKINQSKLETFIDEQYEKGYSMNYVAKQIAILKQIFNFAVEKGFLNSNQNPAAKLKKQEQKNTVTSVWNDEQVKTFLKTARNSPYYAAYLIALSTGLRKGEILGLRWDVIDFSKNRIFVNQILTNDGLKIENNTKTKGSLRSVTVSKEVIDELRVLKKEFDEKEKIFKGAFTENNLVVSSNKGTPVNPRNIGRNMDNLIEKSGLHRITFHSLRHTHATLLMEKGVNMKVVSERLGHTDIRTTINRYTHVAETLQEEAAEKLGELFK